MAELYEAADDAAAGITNRGLAGFKNYLINGDFAINQRAFVGPGLATGSYCYDMWKAASGGANVSLAAGVLTINAGGLSQVIESPNLAGKTITVSVENPSASLNVNVDGITGTIAAGAGRRGVTLTVPSGSTGNVTLTLSGSSVSFSRAQVEDGDKVTAFERRNPGVELALAQRYCHARAGGSASAFLFPGFANSTTAALTVASFPEVMRVAPAVTAKGQMRLQNQAGFINVTFSGAAVDTLGGNVSLTGTGFTTGQPVCLRLNTADDMIIFDAGL